MVIIGDALDVPSPLLFPQAAVLTHIIHDDPGGG